MQNLVRETSWHLRGTRRVGVSREDTETIQQCVSAVDFTFWGGESEAKGKGRKDRRSLNLEERNDC